MIDQESIICSLSTTATPLGGLSETQMDNLIARFSRSNGKITPLLMDYCSLISAVNFDISCKKHSVKGLVGTRVSLQIAKKIVGDIILIAKNQMGYEELIALITTVNYHQHNIEKIKYTNSNLSLGKWVYKTCLVKDLLDISENIYLLCPNFRNFSKSLSKLHDRSDVKKLARIIKTKAIKTHNTEDKKLVDSIGIYLKNITLPDEASENLFKKCLDSNYDDIPEYETSEEILSKSKIKNLYETSQKTYTNTRRNTSNFIKQIQEITIQFKESMPNVDFGIDIEKESYSLLSEMLEEYPLLERKKYVLYLNNELNVLKEIDGTGYYQIIIAFSRYLKSKGVIFRVRGSASSSLVFYLFGVSSKLADPVKQGLVLSRFITSGRQENPDVDIDIPTDQRKLFLEFMESHFGSGAVAAFTNKNTKGSFKELMRSSLALKGNEKTTLTIKDLNRLENKIRYEIKAYDRKDMQLTNVIEKSKELHNAVKGNNELKQLLSNAIQLSNWNNSFTTHQSGMIFDPDMRFKSPRMKNAIGDAVIECTTPSKLGFVKFDILSSRNIELIREIDTIALKQGKQVTIPDTFDARFFNYLYKNTAFLNQMGGNAMKYSLEKIQPKTIFELLLAMALPRPVLSSSDRRELYLRKEGKPYPDLAMYRNKAVMNVLSSTYGFIIFDEQILELCSMVADFNDSDADKVRTAIKKGHTETLANFKNAFVTAATHNNISSEVANQVYSILHDSIGKYSFSKAHALSYASIAVEQAYRKYTYPDITYTAITKVFPYSTSNEVSNKYSDLVAEYKSRGIVFSCPSITLSSRDDFLIKKTGRTVKMFPPLSPIFKGVDKYKIVILDCIEKLRRIKLSTPLTLRDFIDFSADLFLISFKENKESLKEGYKECIHRLIYFGAFDEHGFTKSIPISEGRVQIRNQLMAAAEGYIDDLYSDFPTQAITLSEIDIDIIELTKLESKLFGYATTQGSKS